MIISPAHARRLIRQGKARKEGRVYHAIRNGFLYLQCEPRLQAETRHFYLTLSRFILFDILPAVNDGDSSVEGTMPRTENTECSLISPVRQAVPVAQLTGDRSAETKAFERD